MSYLENQITENENMLAFYLKESELKPNDTIILERIADYKVKIETLKEKLKFKNSKKINTSKR